MGSRLSSTDRGPRALRVTENEPSEPFTKENRIKKKKVGVARLEENEAVYACAWVFRTDC